MEIIDYWNQPQRYSDFSHKDGLSSKYLRRTPSNPRPITPPKTYNILWPGRLRYVLPSRSSLSPELITYRIPNVYDALFRQVRPNQVTFGDQLPPPFGQYPSPSGQSDSWWGKGSSSWVDDFLEADPNYRPSKNQITFGDQRLQTPDQFYRSIFPDWQDLSYQYPSPSGQSDDWWKRGQSVRSGGPTPPIDPSPSPVVPRDRAIVLYSPSQQAASAARTRQAYAAGMDDKMPNASASAKGFTAGGRIAPGTIAHSLTNLGPVDALFSLGSAPFTYANYKSFGATNPQALAGTIGTEGGGVFGGLAGARLGATVGSIFGPMGATGGAILGAVVGGQAGFRLGGKAADELSGLNEANRMRQQQQFYDPATSEVYMPPPPPTPQERMRNEILSSAQNPYMPYMMAQLGGYYA